MDRKVDGGWGKLQIKWQSWTPEQGTPLGTVDICGWVFLDGSEVKTPSAHADVGLICGWGRSPGGDSNPPQYFCLGNCMGRESWRAIVHGVTKN